MAFFKSSATLLLAIVVLELVLVSYYVPQVEASKKKLMRKLKKIKDILPILLALKAKKKKILLLPLPIPMKGDMGDMKMSMGMDWNMPMMQDPCPMQMSFPMMDCGGGNSYGGGDQSFGGGYGNNGGGGYGGNNNGGGNFRGGNGGGNGGY